MSNDIQKGKFKELLDKLQQESWQLELLISGFAIYGLIAGLGSIEASHNEAIALESYYKKFYSFAEISCYILIVNLIIHVVLRGLWIGAIGLRYVSNEIDYDALNYSKRFTGYLEKKVGSFDDYIEKLENYCSILFAVTFLTLFYFIAFFTSIFLVMYIAASFFIDSGIFSEMVGGILLAFSILIYLFLALLVFIDFVTQGFLKKKEWTSFLYMPIYKIFSYLTLSFLYRPLVYNFLDNKFGRRIALILVPIYGFIFYASTLNNVRSNYLNAKEKAFVNYAKDDNYINLLKENNFVQDVAIQSKIIDKPYVRVFIPFKKKIENLILERNTDLKPIEDTRGLRSSFVIGFKEVFNRDRDKSNKTDSIYKIYLKTFNDTYHLKIDSVSYPSEFITSKFNKQLGFEAVLPIRNIKEGKHLLRIDRTVTKEKKKIKEEINEKFAEIPFWYYKD